MLKFQGFLCWAALEPAFLKPFICFHASVSIHHDDFIILELQIGIASFSSEHMHMF